MYDKMVVLIPAYEPTTNFLDLLQELNKYCKNIVVVNDGSSEEYNHIFERAELFATVISYPENEGKGYALKVGLKYILDTMQEECTVVTMDCDGQHKVKDALKLARVALKNPTQLILGKRLRTRKTPLRSRLGNAVMRFTYLFTIGVDVYDTQTGLRAFRVTHIPFMLNIPGKRFEYEMNVLLECPKNGIKIQEVEIDTVYIDGNSHSHFDTLKDSVLVYKEITKFLMASVCSFLIDYIMYTICILLTNKLIISNVISRVISATVNYNLNKKGVFKSDKKGFGEAMKYILLAAVIIILNSAILNILVEHMCINKFWAKVLTECILFFISWIVQKKVIFTHKNGEKNGKHKI